MKQESCCYFGKNYFVNLFARGENFPVLLEKDE